MQIRRKNREDREWKLHFSAHAGFSKFSFSTASRCRRHAHLLFRLLVFLLHPLSHPSISLFILLRFFLFPSPLLRLFFFLLGNRKFIPTSPPRAAESRAPTIHVALRDTLYSHSIFYLNATVYFSKSNKERARGESIRRTRSADMKVLYTYIVPSFLSFWTLFLSSFPFLAPPLYYNTHRCMYIYIYVYVYLHIVGSTKCASKERMTAAPELAPTLMSI